MQGYTNTYTLSGGVHAYLEQHGSTHWDGALFTFDNRLALRADGSAADPLSDVEGLVCFCCGGPKARAPHRNCPNVDCNRLFLACSGCVQDSGGFCGPECSKATHVRPALVQPGQYSKYSHYAQVGQDVPLRRGPGRHIRKQRYDVYA